MRIEHGGVVYEIRADDHCWVVETIKVRTADTKKTKKGDEYASNTVYPGRFDQACKSLLDRMVRDGLTPHAGLEEAVATVAHLYATIGKTTS